MAQLILNGSIIKAPASSYTRPEYGSSTYLDTMGKTDYEAYAPVSYGSRVDLSNNSPMDSTNVQNNIYEDRVNSVLRKYPKYSSGPDYGGSGGVVGGGSSSSTVNPGPGSTMSSLGLNSAVQKSRSYSNFDSLKRTDFSNINTLGQVSAIM